LGLLTSLFLFLILAQEGLLYDKLKNCTEMSGLAIAAVTAALMGMMAAGIYFAVLPGRDPLGMSENGRKLYVYAVEVLFLLLFIHVRLTIPVLFQGQLGKYWTLIVMAIAFIGVGLSEFFKRRNLRVLAEPLERTGVFLPLLPLVAFWVRPPGMIYEWAFERFPGSRPLLEYFRNNPQHYAKYALLWFLVGALYSLVAMTRRSFRFAIIAALAANFGLWALLFHNSLEFLIHPQMWLIPVALILLVAGHLNRDRLTEAQGSGLRYLALLMIYVSSTADMFIAGLGTSVVWPLVLALLSVLGVLSGILLRIRAFLYLGISFLFLVIFSMIWHAAVGRHQIGVWWISGVVLGAAIFALFAVFEKRRNEVLRVIEQFKKWD
jgi:hypothetical protein